MNENLNDLMREATRLTQGGELSEATKVIQRALKGLPGASKSTSHDLSSARTSVDAMLAKALPGIPQSGALTKDALPNAAQPPGIAKVPWGGSRADTHLDVSPERTRSATARAHAPERSDPGEFIAGTHNHASQTRGYKLYVPPERSARALPLVVMLHGCTQDPDDFATGTCMNERAREQGFFVLYPAQSQSANPTRCWNWFKHNHQRRDSGEPAILASMTQAVIKRFDIDESRVFIAGLSAGGAMATIVAGAYPEIFAAVGVHSGLPRGAASNAPEALAVMKSGVAGPGVHSRASHFGSAAEEKVPLALIVPTIVFHGGQDRTVHPRNGEQVIAAVLGSAQVEHGVSAQGRRYTRSIHPGDRGNSPAEHWLVHGAGHAWSGGHAEGSYTDATGPDATREMLRFFFAHPRSVAH